ncbi:UxaA family hydrolase [Acuticoccus sp.]|uniref:UxaA family hydrolase n=1 Tax=Acuticoccus sp. TaxID=1904378 RepID=UPI003B52AACE
MSADAIMLDPADEVATALRALEPGAEAVVAGPDGPVRISVRDAIPAFHKLALTDLPSGTPVRKYGAVIGATTAPIARGGHVHVHNLRSLRARAKDADG